MRLLDTKTGLFAEFVSSLDVQYAILSHLWDRSGEQSYTDVREIQTSSRYSNASSSQRIYSGEQTPVQANAGAASNGESSILDDPRISAKIREACAVARSHGYKYLWIDYCCIDKASSAELSEAINSMFQWYHDAAMCYAYLADVPAGDDPHAVGSFFSRSRWFTRGWTLQELIAPRYLVFLSSDWKLLAKRSELAAVIEQITGIEDEVLTGWKPLRAVSVAKRMSWASGRQTTRVEDEAYALMGIFDIDMPTLYGEGARAFHRLQEEILRRIPDQSIFAWGPMRLDPLSTINTSWPLHLSPTPDVYSPSFLAPSASHFRHCRNIEISVLPPQEWMARLQLSGPTIPGSISLSSYGVHTQMPLIPINHIVSSHAVYDNSTPVYLAVLACELSSWQNPRVQGMLGVVCYAESSHIEAVQSMKSFEIFLNSAQVRQSFGNGEHSGARLLVLSTEDLAVAPLISTVEVRGVYLKADYLNLSRIRRDSVRQAPRVPRLLLSHGNELDLKQRGYLIYHDPVYALANTYDGVLVVQNDRGPSAAVVRFRRRDSPYIPSQAILNRWLTRFPAISIPESGLLDSPDVATVLLPPAPEMCASTPYGDTFLQTSFSSGNGIFNWNVKLNFLAMMHVWHLEIVPPPDV